MVIQVEIWEEDDGLDITIFIVDLHQVVLSLPEKSLAAQLPYETSTLSQSHNSFLNTSNKRPPRAQSTAEVLLTS